MRIIKQIPLLAIDSVFVTGVACYCRKQTITCSTDIASN